MKAFPNGFRPEAKLPNVVRSLATGVMGVMAAAVVTTHLAQVIGISFRLYAVLTALTTLAVPVAMLWTTRTGIVGTLRSTAASAGPLGLIGLLSALVVLLRHQPRLDDFWYIANVVYYVAHPDQAMGYILHFVEAGEGPISSFYQGTALPFEYAQGVLALLLGLEVLTVYHVLVPVFLGFLQPLVWYYLLSRFEFRHRSAVFGTILICLCLLLMGETHRAFGSYGLSRIWHGKVVVMAIGLPLFAGLTIDFLRDRTRGPWIRLFVCAIALIGMSPSTIVLLSSFALLLAASGAAAFPDKLRVTLRTTVAYGLSLSYVVGFAVAFAFFSAANLGSGDPINEGWPLSFLGQAAFVFSPSPPATLGLMTTSICVSLILLRGWQIRFLAAWLLGALIVYLNPIVAPFLIEHVTSPNLYWRLFYLLPFPLTLGLAGAALAERLGVGTTARGNAIAAALVLVLIGAHWLPGSSSIFRNQKGIKLGYKLRHPLHMQARELINVSPQGSMLAPWPLSAVVPVLSGDHPQIRTSEEGLRLWFTEPEVKRRVAASNFLKTGSTKTRGSLKAVLELTDLYPEIRSVVARNDVARKHNLASVLAAEGFTEQREAGKMMVFAKSPTD